MLGVYEGRYELAKRDSTKLREWETDMLLRRRFVKALQDAGAGLLLGTDTFEPVHRELEAFVFFGTLAESGTVTVGKSADLVLIDGNPLQDIVPCYLR